MKKSDLPGLVHLLTNYTEDLGSFINKLCKSDGLSLLHHATMADNADSIVQAICYMPAVNVNLRSARGESALSMALDKKNQTIAQVLLAQGADVSNIDVNGEPLVARMVRTYNVMGLRFLIGEETKLETVNSAGDSALLIAARLLIRSSGSLYSQAREMMTLLLQAAVDPDVRECQKRTALHILAEFGDRSDQDTG